VQAWMGYAGRYSDADSAVHGGVECRGERARQQTMSKNKAKATGPLPD
jgi:hypothetical protein